MIRKRSMIGSVAIRIAGLEAVVEAVGVRRARAEPALSLGLELVLDLERDRCSRRRSVLRNCLDSSLAVAWAGHLADPLVCLRHHSISLQERMKLTVTPPGGGMFAGGPQFATFGGGPGIRIHQFGGNRPRRRPHNHADAEPQSIGRALQSLLPLVLLFLLPLLSSLFQGASPSGPSIRLDKAATPHTEMHTSSRLKVPYWVNPSDVVDYSARKWKELDKVAEGKIVGQLSSECEWEQAQRQRLANEAQGFFFTDMEKLDRARRMNMPSCDRLKGYGYRVGL